MAGTAAALRSPLAGKGVVREVAPWPGCGREAPSAGAREIGRNERSSMLNCGGECLGWLFRATPGDGDGDGGLLRLSTALRRRGRGRPRGAGVGIFVHIQPSIQRVEGWLWVGAEPVPCGLDICHWLLRLVLGLFLLIVVGFLSRGSRRSVESIGEVSVGPGWGQKDPLWPAQLLLPRASRPLRPRPCGVGRFPARS
jgi:hypothetical protein